MTATIRKYAFKSVSRVKEPILIITCSFPRRKNYKIIKYVTPDAMEVSDQFASSNRFSSLVLQTS